MGCPTISYHVSVSVIIAFLISVNLPIIIQVFTRQCTGYHTSSHSHQFTRYHTSSYSCQFTGYHTRSYQCQFTGYHTSSHSLQFTGYHTRSYSCQFTSFLYYTRFFYTCQCTFYIQVLTNVSVPATKNYLLMSVYVSHHASSYPYQCTDCYSIIQVLTRVAVPVIKSSYLYQCKCTCTVYQTSSSPSQCTGYHTKTASLWNHIHLKASVWVVESSLQASQEDFCWNKYWSWWNTCIGT